MKKVVYTGFMWSYSLNQMKAQPKPIDPIEQRSIGMRASVWARLDALSEQRSWINSTSELLRPLIFNILSTEEAEQDKLSNPDELA